LRIARCDAAFDTRNCSLCKFASYQAVVRHPDVATQARRILRIDMQLKQDTEEEARWDPKVQAARIGVTVEMGAVASRVGRHLRGKMAMSRASCVAPNLGALPAQAVDGEAIRNGAALA
jgi:hypothetical protein